MSSIFDFNNLLKLVQSNQPSAIILVDSNVIMDNPDFLQWHSDLTAPIFVLADFTVREFAYISDPKNKKTEDAIAKARAAIRAFVCLTEQGTASSGIHFDDIGWLITIPFPEKDKMEPELDQFSYIKEINHKTDTSLLVLHKELIRDFPRIPVLSLTGDKLYTIFGRSAGLLVYNSQTFPLAIRDWLLAKVPKLEVAPDQELTGAKSLKSAVDPDKELAEAIQRIKERPTKVRLTLISKRFDREGKFGHEDGPGSGAIIAEGDGILYHPELGKFGFEWKLPYPADVIAIESVDSVNDEADPYVGRLPSCRFDFIPTVTFLDRDQEIPHELRSILMEKLLALAEGPYGDLPADLPTLDNPLYWLESWMKSSFNFIGIYNSILEEIRVSEGENPVPFIEPQADIDPHPFKDLGALRNYCIDFLSRSPVDTENIATLVDLMLSNWNVGRTIELILPPDEISTVDNN